MLPEDPSRRGLWLCALRFEASALANASRHLNVQVVTTGVGPVRAKETTIQQIETIQPDYLVGLGFCGGLRAGVARGDIVIPSEVMDGASGETIRVASVPSEVLERLRASTPSQRTRYGGNLHQGERMVSVDRIAGSVEAKRRLHDSSNASFVDQESYTFAAVAKTYGLPISIIRVVLDGPGDRLPSWRTPKDWPTVFRIPYQAIAARSVLQDVGSVLTCVHW